MYLYHIIVNSKFFSKNNNSCINYTAVFIHWLYSSVVEGFDHADTVQRKHTVNVSTLQTITTGVV